MNKHNLRDARWLATLGCMAVLGVVGSGGTARADEPIAEGPMAWVEPALDMTPSRQVKAMKEDVVRRLTPEQTRGTLVTAGDYTLGVRHLPESNGGRGVSWGTVYYPFNMGAGQQLADPQFLPGGRGAVVKIKFQPVRRQPPSYHLYRIDFEKMTLKKLTAEMIIHDTVSLSPNGKYAAYLRSVDAGGKPLVEEVARLCVLDLQSGQEKIVARDNSLPLGTWDWTRQSTLIVTMVAAVPANGAAGEGRPHLYEVAATGGDPKLLVRDGWWPRVSPDGSRIAFFGAEDPAKPGGLAANWRTNPRGAFICVALRDGTNRRALRRQSGAYPVLQWQQDSRHLIIIKAKKWINDIGDTKISNFQPLRADEYKGGLTGVLDTDTGAWNMAFVLDEGVSPHDFYNRYPNPNVDYVFTPIGPSGDGKFDFVRGYYTKKTEQGTTVKHILWGVKAERRAVKVIAEMDESSRGFDWLDASAPGVERPKLPTALGQARLDTPADIVPLKTLFATLPQAGPARKEIMDELVRRAGQEIAEPPLPEGDVMQHWWARIKQLDRKDGKAMATAAYEALSMAQRLLASDNADARASGLNLALDVYRTLFNEDNTLASKILFAFAVPNVDAVQYGKTTSLSGFMFNVLMSARYVKVPENFTIDILKILVAQSEMFDPIGDATRVQLAQELAKQKRYGEAIEYLKQVVDERPLAEAQRLMAEYEKLAAAP